MLEVSDWGLTCWFRFGYDHWSLICPWSEFWLSILIWKVQGISMSLSLDLGLWWGLEVPDWGLASWYWFGYGHWSLVHPYSKFWLSILILKVQRTCMSFKSSFGACEDTEGSWLGFRILILIWIWSLVFDKTIFKFRPHGWLATP